MLKGTAIKVKSRWIKIYWVNATAVHFCIFKEGGVIIWYFVSLKRTTKEGTHCWNNIPLQNPVQMFKTKINTFSMDGTLQQCILTRINQKKDKTETFEQKWLRAVDTTAGATSNTAVFKHSIAHTQCYVARQRSGCWRSHL